MNTAINSDPIFSPLERKMHRETLKYAVGRAIYCQECGTVLDFRKCTLVTHKNPSSMSIRCTSCWDGVVDRMPDAAQAEMVKCRESGQALYENHVIEIIDGRTLARCSRS